MKPYYEHAGVTIYHGDCREVLPHITADVLVTDPPYGVEFDGKATKHTARGSGGYTVPDCGEVGPEVVRVALALVKRGAVFTGNRRLTSYPPPQDIGCIYCPSGAGIGPWGFVCFHPVAFYGRRLGPLRPASMESFATADECGHPCPKPLPWLLWAVGMVSAPNETVLDPFMGSGTTLRAAKDLGRRAIGIELEERYCEIAARRLSQEVLPLGGAA